MVDEKLAKEKLEDEAGIYFEYTRAKYDDATKVWFFTVANKDGRRVLRASQKEDFAPYIALSRHLKLDFEEFIKDYVWIYGDEIEIIPNEDSQQYCLTSKGWLALSNIVKAFTDKFGEYSKDNLLKSITWKLVIDKNECSSSTYKKNEKPGWPNVNTSVSLSFSELEDKVLNIQEVVWGEKEDENIPNAMLSTETDSEDITLKEEMKTEEQSEQVQDNKTESRKLDTPQEDEENSCQDVIISQEDSSKVAKNNKDVKKKATQQNKDEDHSDIIQLESSQYQIAKDEQMENNNPSSTDQQNVKDYKEELSENVDITNMTSQVIASATYHQTQELQQESETFDTHRQDQESIQTNKTNSHPIAFIIFIIVVVISVRFACSKSGSKYTINFDPKGGVMYSSSIKATAGETFRLPTKNDVTREGYVLIGWIEQSGIPEQYIAKEGEYVEMKKDFDGMKLCAIWGRELYVNDYKLNIRREPNAEVKHNIAFTLKRGDKVIMFEDSYQGEYNYWASVIAKNPETCEEEVLFANVSRLNYFYIDDILFGNQKYDGTIITPPSLTPNLYAEDMCYLTPTLSIRCAKGRSGQETFRVVIKTKDTQGNLYTFADYTVSDMRINDSTEFIGVSGWGTDTPGVAYKSGKRYYVDIMYKNKNFPYSKEIRIANKEILVY